VVLICRKSDRAIIYIQPVGEMVEMDNPAMKSPCSPSLELLIEYTKCFYASEKITDVKLLPFIPVKKVKKSWYLEKTKIESRKGLDHDEIQLQINDILKYMSKNVPKDAYCVMGVTMYDLYMEEEDLFLAGWAGGNMKSGIFSFARYDPFYLERSDTSDYHTDLIYFDDLQQDVTERKRLILQRSIKTLTHELLHKLGFEHCIYFMCLMNGTGNLTEDDKAPFHCCPVCLRKLDFQVKINFSTYYQDLKAFFIKMDHKEEAQWIQNRIDFICKKRKLDDIVEKINV
jgi:predicted Zn-dependent protease